MISDEERAHWHGLASRAAESQTDVLIEAFGGQVSKELHGVLRRLVWADTVSTEDQKVIASAVRDLRHPVEPLDRDGSNITSCLLLNAHHEATGEEWTDPDFAECAVCGFAAGVLHVGDGIHGHTTQVSETAIREWIAIQERR